MDLRELIEAAKNSRKEEILGRIENVLKILKKEKKDDLVIIQPKNSLIVVGDLHGDLKSLTFILEHSNFLETKDKIIFLGDYGDRGEYSAEVYYLLLTLKENFPGRVFLLRGNHEFPKGLEVYPHDLPFWLAKKYKSEEVYERIKEFWSYLYTSALVEGKYLFVHGGIPVNLDSIEELKNASKFHPEKSFLEEILWNDPDEIENFFPSPRGAGKIFGKNITERVLRIVKAKTLIRSHEPVGIKVNHSGLVLTISSTKVYGTYAAYLKINLEEEVKNAFELAEIAFRF